MEYWFKTEFSFSAYFKVGGICVKAMDIALQSVVSSVAVGGTGKATAVGL